MTASGDPTSPEQIEFRLFGGIEAHSNGVRVDLGHSRQQCVLAILLVEANAVVGTDELIDRVWAGQPPHRAKDSLYSYLTRLRRALPEIAITRRGTGYTLTAERDSIDLHRFRRLVSEAAATDDAIAADLLREALAIARGEAFAGQDNPWLNTIRAAFDKERSAAELDHIDSQLRLGRHNEILPKLATLATDQPLDERLAGQYLLALYRAGRQADALSHYQQTRTHLADQLGIDPSPPLRDLHQRILTTDPTLTVHTPEPTAQSPVPRQLPAAPRSFAGRIPELDRLTSAMDAHTTAAATVVISAIGGVGGIGKTWLALHWAHQNISHFPDGQLFVNLRGFDPSGKPSSPHDAVTGFLDALGVEPSSMPTTLDAQSALYRSLVAGKHMLIMLDNAADPAQVVPLLPGSPSCTVIVTSRDRLVSLVNAHGAQPLPLDALSVTEAHALLANRLGADRLAREPEAVNDLIMSCAGMPLALSIVAGRALEHPDFPLADLAEELRDSAGRLNTLDEDPETGVRSVLTWSYTALTEEQARTFSMLGLAPGADISQAAAANLTNLDDNQIRVTLRALERVSLVQQEVPGRYRMHDLVRLYAREQAEQLIPTTERDTALARLVGYYAHSAYANELKLQQGRQVIDFGMPPQDCRPTVPADRAQAATWFTVELGNLLACLELAEKQGLYELLWQLAWSMNTFNRRQGNADANVTTWLAALNAARRLGNVVNEGLALRALGTGHSHTGRTEMGLEYAYQALALAEKHDLRTEQIYSHTALTFIWESIGEYQKAYDHSLKYLELLDDTDDATLRAHGFNAVGWTAAQLEQYTEAKRHCEAALAIQVEIDDLEYQSGTLDSLGYIEHRLGNSHQAVDYYQRSLKISRTFGDVYNEANALQSVGEIHADLGDHEKARSYLQEALGLCVSQQRSEKTQHIRELLRKLDQTPANLD